MTVLRGFMITIASGLLLAGAGGIAGYGLGAVLPDYFRIVFHIPPGLPVDPIQVGVGLGITEGLAAGLVIGLIIVVAVAWYESRVKPQS